MAIILSILYGTYRRIPPSWSPTVDIITLESGGADRTIRLAETSLIPVTYTQPLQVVSVGGVFAVTDRRWILGSLARVSETLPAHSNLDDSEFQVVVSPRKHSLGPRGDCFDANDILKSEWIPMTLTRWKIDFPAHEWVVGPDWEAIKVAVLIRKHGDDTSFPAVFPSGGSYVIDFAVPEGSAGLKRRMGASIYGTIEREFQKCP